MPVIFRPPGLSARGSALWDELVKDGDPVSRQVLAAEACRLSDRLDRLEALVGGDVDVWARLVHRTQTSDYELHIDAAVSEARHSVAQLRQVLAQLGGQQQVGNQGVTLADEIAARRAAREAGAAGQLGS